MGTPPFRSGGRNVVAALVAALCCIAGPGVHGADWTITPRIGASETFTDNIGLATGRDANRRSDLITAIEPGVAIQGTGSRVRLNLNYSLTETFHLQTSDRNSTRHNLASNAHVELWERVAFIDAVASIDQRRLSSEGPTSVSPVGRDVNAVDVRSYNVMPSFRHHFGTWVETLTRISYGQVDVGTAASGTGAVRDTTTLRETLTVSSGRRFSTLLWSVTADSAKTTYTDDFPSSRRRVLDTNYTYVLDSKLSLLAGLGYEDIEERTLITQPKGITWNLGFAARPSGRSSVRATYGERNDRPSLDFAASYQLSERSQIHARYNESIETSQRMILEGLTLTNIILVPDGTGGFTIVPEFTPEFGLQDAAFRRKRLTVGADGSRRRNTFGGSVFWESRETEATNTTETIYGINLRLNRTLSSRSSGGVSVSYLNRDFGTAQGREDTEIGGTLSFTYQIFNDVDGIINYHLTRRVTNNADADLLENAVTLRLSKRF